MLRYFKKISDTSISSLPVSERSHTTPSHSPVLSERKHICPSYTPRDPGERPSILDYHPNDRDKVRRKYMQQGPCQPKKFSFPLREFGNKRRRFNKKWYKTFSQWLEYSKEKDAAFCLCCYLFRPSHGDQSGGDTFVGKNDGFTNWNNGSRLHVHVGGFDSAHNKAWRDFVAMNNQRQNIEHVFARKNTDDDKEYRIRLSASVGCIRWLLKQGLALRGHDESEESHNHGNFLELLQYTTEQNPEVKVVALKNAKKNLKLTSPDIQKDIVHAVASLTSYFG